MANVFFNELSANGPVADLADSLKILAEDISFLNKLKLGKLIYHAGDYGRLTALFFDENKQFHGLVEKLDRESKQLIYYFLGSTRPLSATAQKHIEQTANVTVDYLTSYLDLPLKIGAVSFRSKASWFNWQLVFSQLAAPHHAVSLPHVAFLSPNISTRSVQLETFILSLPPEAIGICNRVDCLPRLPLSSRYFEEMKEVYVNAQKVDRIGAHTIVGAAIARINGYEARPDVEKLNKNGEKIRHIFYNARLDKYLSIDIMHGLFEVCSGNGSHLKEIKFSGEEMSGPESNHSIRVP